MSLHVLAYNMKRVITTARNRFADRSDAGVARARLLALIKRPRYSGERR